MPEEGKTRISGWITFIATILGLVLVWLKRKFSKAKQLSDIEKQARRDIREIDRLLAKGDLEEVAIMFLKQRREVLLATAGYEDD